jgi:bifunctional polynucleotide phosphatase/kinase
MTDNGQMNPEGRQMLPGIAFRSFVQRYQEPTLAEGFSDITIVNFEVRCAPVKLKGCCI